MCKQSVGDTQRKRKNLLRSIHDPRDQNQLAPRLATLDLPIRQPQRVRVVGPVQQHDVRERHAHQQRHEGQQHHPVLQEDLLRADVPPAHAEQDDGDGVEGAPPRDQQRGLVLAEVPQRGRRGREAAEDVHGGGGGDDDNRRERGDCWSMRVGDEEGERARGREDVVDGGGRGGRGRGRVGVVRAGCDVVVGGPIEKRKKGRAERTDEEEEGQWSERARRSDNSNRRGFARHYWEFEMHGVREGINRSEGEPGSG